MSDGDQQMSKSETLSARLTGLTDASLRISEDLDIDIVLQEVADSARKLTSARFGVITTQDESGNFQDLLLSGLTPQKEKQMLGWPLGDDLFAHLRDLRVPLRTADFVAYAADAGFPGFPFEVGSFLGLQIRVRDVRVGNIYIGGKAGGGEFTADDEQTLEMFAAQATMAITNARRYGDEQRAKADLEALVNTSPVGVVVFDARTREPVKVNYEARRIAGAAKAEETDFSMYVDQLAYQRIDGQEIPRSELPLERVIRTGEAVRAEEIVILRPDGDTVTTLFNATPIRSDDGDILSVVATVQDMTPLAEMERLRAEFLGMVSHELRVPLTSIKGAAATAQGASSPLDSSETNQFFRIIEEQADLMRDLINNLLDLTHIETGTLSVSPEPADLAPVIEQAKAAFAASGQSVDIKVQLDSGLPQVLIDPRRIGQVLHNLFANASKFSPEWSTIEVTVRQRDLHVVVAVSDDGIGIESQRLPGLFNKFSRNDSGGEGRVRGYGLGLAICKGIVEAHGGRIWAESDGLGYGAQITFTLPFANTVEAATETGPQASSSTTAPTRIERIMAVDDDPHTLRYIRSTLADAGYTHILTGDPAEFDRLLEAEEPHLVLLDLVLPGTDGFQLMRRIPSGMGVPVIILSGRGGDQELARAFEMGAADYIVKPFSPTELLARISAVLRRRTLTQQANVYRLGDLTVDFAARTVKVGGQLAKLTPTEHRLLHELCSNAGRALTYDQILNQVWGQGTPGDERRVRTSVKDLRRKIGDDARKPKYIITVSGVGYRMATTESP